MEGITLALGLGAAVVKSATKLWLGDRPIAADVSASAIDILVGRTTGALERRKARRLFEQLEEVVAERLAPLLEREFQHLAGNERQAAVAAVRETIDRAALTDNDLFAADLDAAYLNRYVRRTVPGVRESYRLSQSGDAFYDRLLLECCACLVQITSNLPAFQVGALTEILQRESEALGLIREVLRRLPDRRLMTGFEADYRQQVGNSLDRLELFGARVSKASRKYPLTVAYLSLTMSDRTGNQRAEALLADTKRLLIRGEAGSGKTTLLQWIAVRCANNDLPEQWTSWQEPIPFFVRLRRYADAQLPAPEHFLDELGRHIADEMETGWVQRRLRFGQAVVLIDGVDEFPEDRRSEVQEWLEHLITAFPAARYIVTSRPAAADADWLEDYEFASAELQQMTPSDVRSFVHRWHQAIASQCVEQDEIDELDALEAQLVRAIADRRALRNLSGNPLLCALLCAMHREQRGKIPDSRMELYDTTLTILLEGREKERRLPQSLAISRTEQLVLLCDLAYWMVRNNLVDAERERALDRLRRRLEGTAYYNLDPSTVYRYLLERTGLLRETVVGRVDFVHRTFQEYLAAKAAIEMDDIGVLIDSAHLEPWYEVVVMAVGHASRQQRDELLGRLLAREERDERITLLCVACLETSPDLAPDLRAEIQRHAERLLPPRDHATAMKVARAGEFVLDLLARSSPHTDEEVAGTIAAAAAIGGDAALQVIARCGALQLGLKAVQALVNAWSIFDLEEYAKLVLRDSPLADGLLEISEPALLEGLPLLRHLTELRCFFTNGNGSLEFLRTLPDLRRLEVMDPTLADLSPVSGTQLEALFLYSAHGSVIELHGLEGSALTELTVLEPATGWNSLSRVPRLRRLDFDVSTNSLADVLTISGWALDTLGIFNISEPIDLSALARRRLQTLVLRSGPFRVRIDAQPLRRKPGLVLQVEQGIEVLNAGELEVQRIPTLT
jgi:hypothetical protein